MESAFNHIFHELRNIPQITTSAAISIATAANAPLPNPVGVDGVSSIMTSPVPTAMAIATGSPKGGDDQSECRLLGSFALFVQLALGGLAMLSLVYKRWRERPQRPVKIWFFDVSKQVFGSVLVHVANVFMSMLTSGRFSVTVEPASVATMRTVSMMMLRRMAPEDAPPPGDDFTPNPCSFYLLNLAIDTTLGIPILIVLLRIFTSLVSYTPLGKPAESIQSGNYGNPPKVWWWLKQSVIYFCGLFGMKICVLVIFLTMPWISRVGDWALSWTEGNERVQIVFVMMLFPLIMNALQYYIIDSFIKKQASKDGGEGTGEGRPTAGAYERISEAGSSDEEGEGGHNHHHHSGNLEEETFTKTGAHVQSIRRPGDDEYDPDIDGDESTVTASGSSPGKGDMPSELYPKE
ncbi:hypothetical protein VMCG_01206 [Cytospora schulzeri]|uniref:Vacuolar membrane protein n=1 Tax=Cytospora schulzeri TaxID=448051 RepID=A0A423X6S4_9PEZI|nr:hypothetical protein VMCG_01206 [Valsa malicola]